MAILLSDDLRAQFDRVLAGRQLTALFQPVVELDSERVVGYEALARGPQGTPFEAPAMLFKYAYERGRSAELDWAWAGRPPWVLR